MDRLIPFESWSKTVLFPIMPLYIGIVGSVFANSPGNQGSLSDRVMPKT